MKKWGSLAALVALLVLGGGLIGFRLALGLVKAKVVEALGPESEIQQLTIGWSGVEVLGLRIRGRAGWPAPDTLRAERVVIVPSLWSLLSGTVRIRSVTAYRPYASVLRTKDGKLRLIPSLLDRPRQKARPGGASKPTKVAIGRIRLEEGTVELFDATVAQPPHKIRLERIQATVEDVRLPSLRGKTRLDVTAMVKGVQRDGTAKVTGWVEVATSESSIETELRGLDLRALQPYIAKNTSAQVRQGTVDLTLHSEVSQNRLKAPGQVVISDLQFDPEQGAGGTFLGVSRDAVLSFMRGQDNRISLSFVIEGDLGNPQFSLNEALTMRIAAGLASALGVGLESLARGLGTLGIKGGEATGEAIKGLGDAIKGLFGEQKTP
jgi:hypothetical protein